MKRQKRDRMERAHARGYQAGVIGRSREDCPYQSIEPRSQWMGGWREAVENRTAGITPK
ncbi:MULTISPECIES: ribosome modulation factor [Corallincola]|uniref:Ribosome modulation factor n=3 Tax=Corallincola TaxID=1775176 RepID=A0A368NQV2_9GAMM|nr:MULTISPECIES: ribosome modulation factor [Corallincola]RCU52947.1 ribosome modulation factor [Corallincola holothuriorum]TAA48735.1 ribosome modulation factor [Corallincola spongiicola]TCI03408.1 ribosome modulation factor [Corallincola luteus]